VLLQSSFTRTPARDLSEACSLRGLIPRRDLTETRPLTAKVPRPPLRSVLRLSLPLDGLLRVLAPWVCFTPQPRPGFTAVQGLLARRSHAPSPKQLPPCRWSSFSSAARPEGLAAATSGDLDFEAFIHTEKRSQAIWCYPPRWPLPSSGSSPSRFAVRILCAGYPTQAARGLRRSDLREPKPPLISTAALQRISVTNSRPIRLRLDRTCSKFRASLRLPFEEAPCAS
jgi:hypothetical protein